MTMTDIIVIPAAAMTADEAAARAAHIAGLRALADKLETCPEVPLPFDGRTEPVTFHFLADGDPGAAMAAAARALGGRWKKSTRDYGDAGGGAYLDLTGALHGLKIKLTAYRDAVCQRIVTGTREVTERAQDPGLLAAVPFTDVTKTVDTVSWVCSPIMASANPLSAEPKAGGWPAISRQVQREQIAAYRHATDNDASASPGSDLIGDDR